MVSYQWPVSAQDAMPTTLALPTTTKALASPSTHNTPISMRQDALGQQVRHICSYCFRAVSDVFVFVSVFFLHIMPDEFPDYIFCYTAV